MKEMKIFLIKMAVLIVVILPMAANADTQLANQNLQRAINELEAAKVYIQQAKEQEPPNQRVVFHYDSLLSDIGKIEGGIEQKFNMPKIQPRTIEPLSGDYIAVVGKSK